MWHTRFRRWFVRFLASFIAGSLIVAIMVTAASAQVLVGNPFITSYQNWIDPDQARGGNWRLSLHNPTIMETSDLVPTNPASGTNNGTYVPSLLIQDDYSTPTTYDLNARMYTSDDDGWGLVFGYQNVNNYYRVLFRAQANGNLGGTTGTSVQKVVNGVATQISPVGAGAGNTVFPQLPSPIGNPINPNSPIPQIDTPNVRLPVDARVSVNGTSIKVYVAGINGDAPLVDITDAGLQPGKIGVQSWAQRIFNVANKHWGTELESINVKQGATTLFSNTFNQANAGLAVKWRPLYMTNSDGLKMDQTTTGEDAGNFGLDINSRWIYQQTNGFRNATATAPNVDFAGPAAVVDNAGANSMTNYEMRVRMGTTDNDGIGVIVRAQDDNNFYRVMLTNEAIGATTNRSPQGLSIQKVRNGVWSELYRDNQAAPMFVYPFGPGTPATTLPQFDLRVGVVDNQIKVTVVDQSGNVIRYPVVTDATDPLLAGSAGFTTWGTDNVYYTNFRNDINAPLISAISAFNEFDVTIDRATGNVTVQNNSPGATAIKGLSFTSPTGELNAATWTSISSAYDEPPGNGTVDPDDPWTITSSTDLNLTEVEQSVGGNGASLAVAQTINLGNFWRKSRLQDVGLLVTLADGSTAIGNVSYTGTALNRSDLNTDGSVNASDWPLFYPNMNANLSALTGVGKALAGDLDGDGDNDVTDFGLFKADWDLVNGAGSFDAFLAGVPEPSSLLLILVGVIGSCLIRRRPSARIQSVVLTVAAVTLIASSASAVPVDLTTFTTEAYTPASGFATPAWTVSATSASHPSNQDASVLYAPDSALNKRYIGTLTPGTDDDVIGFVLGFDPGEAPMGATGEYILIDWKGATQSFEFVDTVNTFHDLTDNTTTGTGTGFSMPVGLAISRVTGSPTADEMWAHADIPHVDSSPSLGAVQELARGLTKGNVAYNRTGGSHLFDITYTATNVKVYVDGVKQFDLNGTFGDGRFGLYSAFQGPTETFSNFSVVPSDFGVSALVDRSTGVITLRNTATVAVDFDYYELTSATNTLKIAGWNSLSDQNFQSVGGGDDPGESWDEAGGSSASSLAEVFLQAGSTLAPGASIAIGAAYNNILNGQDLVLKYRLPTGSVLDGAVSYIGVAPTGVPGDYNGNGVVDAADYVRWRNGDSLMNEVVTPGSNTPEDYTAWRARFGNTSGSGAGLGGGAAVPEPTSLGLIACVALMLVGQGYRTGRQS